MQMTPLAFRNTTARTAPPRPQIRAAVVSCSHPPGPAKADAVNLGAWSPASCDQLSREGWPRETERAERLVESPAPQVGPLEQAVAGTDLSLGTSGGTLLQISLAPPHNGPDLRPRWLDEAMAIVTSSSPEPKTGGTSSLVQSVGPAQASLGSLTERVHLGKRAKKTEEAREEVDDIAGDLAIIDVGFDAKLNAKMELLRVQAPDIDRENLRLECLVQVCEEELTALGRSNAEIAVAQARSSQNGVLDFEAFLRDPAMKNPFESFSRQKTAAWTKAGIDMDRSAFDNAITFALLKGHCGNILAAQQG